MDEHTNFEAGTKVICPDYDTAVEQCKKLFPNFMEASKIQTYLQILHAFCGTSLTVESYRYGRYLVFKEKDLAPDHFNYPADIFEKYFEDNDSVVPLFGKMLYV